MMRVASTSAMMAPLPCLTAPAALRVVAVGDVASCTHRATTNDPLLGSGTVAPLSNSERTSPRCAAPISKPRSTLRGMRVKALGRCSLPPQSASVVVALLRFAVPISLPLRARAPLSTLCGIGVTAPGSCSLPPQHADVFVAVLATSGGAGPVSPIVRAALVKASRVGSAAQD